MLHMPYQTEPMKESVKNRLLLFVLLIGTAIVYFPTLWYGFLYDDLPTIVRYVHVRTLDFKNHFFGNSRWVSRILNQLTYHFWGTDPFAYRLMDLVIHLLCGGMLFYMIVAVCKRQEKNSLLFTHRTLFASLVSALFLLHPVQTQTVTYVTQMRLEGLVGFFACAVVLTFLQAMYTTNTRSRYILLGTSLLLNSFAAGTKEIIVALPVLLVLVDWFFVAQGNWQSLRSRLLLHGAYTSIMFLLLAKFGIATPDNISALATNALGNHRGNMLTADASQVITPLMFLASQGKVLLHYISIFFWPVNLSFDYDVKLAQNLFGVDVIVPWLLLGMLACALLRLFWQDRTNIMVFGFAWFFAAMLPRTSIIPSTELICDYKTYLASIGMSFVLGYLLLRLVGLASLALDHLGSLGKSHIVAWSFLLLCSGMSYATWQRNKVWSTEEEFWKDVALYKAPNKARAHNNYGTCRWEKNDVELALKHFSLAIELDSNYGEPHVNIAAVHQTLARSTQDPVERARQRALAFGHYERAMEIGEAHPEMFTNLGLYHLDDNNKEQAELCFLQAVDISPVYSPAHKHLAKLYQETGNTDAAAKHFALAARGNDAGDLETQVLLASTYLDQGNAAAARTLLEPLAGTNIEQINFLLGCCAFAQRKSDEACTYFQKACTQNPNSSEYRYNYGQALMAAAKYQEAYETFGSCLQESGSLPYVPLHMAHCLVKLGHLEEATSAADILIQHSPLEQIRKDALAFKQEHKLGSTPTQKNIKRA